MTFAPNMSASEDETEYVNSFNESDLQRMRDMAVNNERCRMHVSAWDDADDIEEVENPEGNVHTHILWAAENGDIDVVKRLVGSEPTLLTTKDKDGYTPLHRACYNNHVPVVEYLLSMSADINAVTEDAWQPLHSACNWNNAECAERLIGAGADINAKTKGGQTPLHLAAAKGDAKETLELLLMNKELNASIKNQSGETAKDVARRTPLYHMFKVLDPSINQLDSHLL